MKRLKHALHWFELPVRDISRAKKFYEAAFELKLSDLNLANGLTMALFPVEEGTIGGALCQHKDFYHPGQTGPVVYLNADPDLQPILARIVQHGGKVIVSKTQISAEFGYMAIFEDVEGNRIALHSVS